MTHEPLKDLFAEPVEADGLIGDRLIGDDQPADGDEPADEPADEPEDDK